MARSKTITGFCSHGPLLRSCSAIAACLLFACLFAPSAAATGEFDEIRAAIRVRDFGKAVPLLETLASSGNPDAQYQLAALYRAGSGVCKGSRNRILLAGQGRTPESQAGPVQPGRYV